MSESYFLSHFLPRGLAEKIEAKIEETVLTTEETIASVTAPVKASILGTHSPSTSSENYFLSHFLPRPVAEKIELKVQETVAAAEEPAGSVPKPSSAGDDISTVANTSSGLTADVRHGSDKQSAAVGLVSSEETPVAELRGSSGIVV